MYFIDIHTHQKSTNGNVFSIVNKYPNSVDFSVPFSIGIHPWFIDKDIIEQDFLVVEEKLEHKNCIALGECGLDKLTKTDFELQKSVFKKHIQLSEKHQKALVIHCVKAFQELFEFHKEWQPKQNWIIHGFSKNLQVAESLLKNGMILSFGASIINNKKLQEVVLKIPLDKFFIETDNSEIRIEKIYQKVANIKRIEVLELQQIIEKNFRNIFRV